MSATMTNRDGSSRFFDRGFVTYSNESKEQLLGVAPQTLLNFGAVSEETALEMASGTIKKSLADTSLSITGIAGPGGGTAEKPVGTVCFGWALPNGKLISTTQHFPGDRQTVRTSAAAFAISELYHRLQAL